MIAPSYRGAVINLADGDLEGPSGLAVWVVVLWAIATVLCAAIAWMRR